MATAIRDVELSRPLDAIDGLTPYSRCRLTFRWRHVVLGERDVPVHDGVVGRDAIRVAAGTLGAGALHVWCEDALGFDGRPAHTPGDRPSVTVAVCTRERPQDLRRTLTAVTALDPPADEILVIDNEPRTDGTQREVARHPGVRYVVEPIPGLDVARNRALREAAGAIVAFTDDDAVPEPGWAGALSRNFADPRVMLVTGLVLPLELETDAQEQFEAYCGFARGFARRVFNGRVEHPLLVSRIGAGASMAVRRDLPARIGGFDERLDAGTPAQSGGDHEMFTRVLAAGYRIVYEPHAVSRHRHRRTDAELRQAVRGYGTGVTAMWTGLALERRELGVVRLAWRWFRHGHLPWLLRPRRWRASAGRDVLVREEWLGTLAGPFAWLRSASRRRRLGA